MEVRTYTYEKLMIREDEIAVYSNPKHHPRDAYLGHGEWTNWTMGCFTIEGFAKQILFGKIVVEEVPEMVSRYKMEPMQVWNKVEQRVAEMRERGNFTVDKCPCCGSENIEQDADQESDGCAADWATWVYWSIWCEDCDDFKLSNQYVVNSGGW